MSDHVIEVRGLTKRYRSALAVDDLGFDVRPGAVTGFLGGRPEFRRRSDSADQ